jgi:galactokinase
MKPVDPDDLVREFEGVFSRSPRLYRAPGRVNLIGEHTDYNDGFVMPIALDRSTWVAAAPRDDRTIVVRSREYGETIRIDRIVGADLRFRPGADTWVGPDWGRYIHGVATILDSPGADMLIASDVPIGAGVSSSAALEVACAYALQDLAGAPLRGVGAPGGSLRGIGAPGGSNALIELARACQLAEHEYAGTRCGVMDQMIACFGREGHALMLDTRSLERRWLPLPATVRVLACNTMVKHQLASGEYNARRADCEAGVAVLARRDPEIRALRDATLGQLDAAAGEMPDRVYRRCRHVIGENARVHDAARALHDGDFGAFGRLMVESHASLRDDYEVSCAELDAMVTIARECDGVYGARMTGGGFGGCAIALVDEAAAAAVRREVAARYERETGLCPDVWICAAGPGVASVPLREKSGVAR